MSKDIGVEIHAKAEPFIKWLKEAEEEETETEDEDEVEVSSPLPPPLPSRHINRQIYGSRRSMAAVGMY